MSHDESLADRIETLESIIEEQQATIERLEKDRLDPDIVGEDHGSTSSATLVSRRRALQAAGVAGLVGLGAGSAVGDDISPSSTESAGQVGLPDRPVNTIYTDRLFTDDLNGGLTGGEELIDLAGDGLAIENGRLRTTDDGSVDSHWQDAGDDLLEPIQGYDGVDLTGSSRSKINAESLDVETVENDATAIRGHASASDVATETTGVAGITDADGDVTASPEVVPTGVHGRATGDNITYGVQGDANSLIGRGVAGFNTSESYEHNSYLATAIAVLGVTDRSGADDGILESGAVIGISVAEEGATFGVVGSTESPDGRGVLGISRDSDGVAVFADGDSRTQGDHTVTGDAEIRGRLEAADGVVHKQRGEPTTTEVGNGDAMIYNSDGSDGHEVGDLVYATNDGGSILTQVIAAKADAS